MRKLLAFVLYLYLQFVFYSSKWTGRLVYENRHIIDDAAENHFSGKPFILCFWHGRLAMMPKLSTRKHRTYVMISEHGDGQLMADVCRHFGLFAVRGSSNRKSTHVKGAKNRGGSRVYKEAINTLRAGNNIAITPDGPKGPRMYVQQGVIHLAATCGAPIVPAAFSTSFGKVVSSWDRFLVPFPFGKLVITIGEPLFFLKGDNEEKRLEEVLNQLTWDADRRAGRAAVMPEGL